MTDLSQGRILIIGSINGVTFIQEDKGSRREPRLKGRFYYYSKKMNDPALWIEERQLENGQSQYCRLTVGLEKSNERNIISDDDILMSSANMDIDTGRIVIIGTSQGIERIEEYLGLREAKAVRSAFYRTRKVLADVGIWVEDVETHSQGESQYYRLSKSLIKTDEKKVISDALIQRNPGALLAIKRRGKASAASTSAQNGLVGGRPVKNK